MVTTQEITSNPVIATDGTIYVGLVQFGSILAIVNDPGGLATTPWAMYQHDQYHSGHQ